MPALPDSALVCLLCLAILCCLVPPAPCADQPKRYPIPPDCIRHEIGHCYIASMDFGEEGDKFTGNKSGLLLFEDGKPLGPPRSIHQHIRDQGEGRYSHWTRNALYMSASDNSDPRTNGRKYEVASTHPESALGGLERFTAEPKKHVEVIRTSRHEYAITLGGNVDYENSHTRHNGGFATAFQPNISLTIENTGDTPVFWPKLIANGVRDWSTYDSLLEDFTRGATNDQEIAYFIWQTARENRYHCSPLFADNEFHDPVKMFNSYGLNLCDDMGYCGCSLFKHAGLGKPKYSIDPKVRCLHGHMMCEAVVNDEHQFIDIDESVFYLDRECDHPVSGDACARDHDLVRREVQYGPVFGGWQNGESNAALFGNDDGVTHGFLRGHEMSYTLRPREKAIFRWDNIGKYACQSEKWNHRPPHFGNSKFVYRPRLAPEHYKEGIQDEADIIPATAEGAQLAGASENAHLTYAIAIPWVICGGTLRAEFMGLSATDKFALDVVLDEKTSTRVWEGAGPGQVSAKVSIDEALQPHLSPAKYKYLIVVTLASGDEKRGANLKSLQMDTDVMAAPLSLPRLRRGVNTFVYTARRPDTLVGQTPGHEVTITHEWQECHEITPPPPPSEPDYPPSGATIRDSIVTLKWPGVEGCKTCHIQVTRREDFRIPYRPAYDVIINATEWCVPYTGMFAPDTTYYWHLRARDKWGVWSEWSPAWTFRWEGLRVPVNVRKEVVDEGIVLRWQPNPRGAHPVAYDVYGSDEKGFSVHKEEYESYKRGKVPANFLAHTADTFMLVVSPEPTHENMNRCYYRVVAIDEHGTESICSDYVEMPHPHFWSKPPTHAEVGKAFSYQPGIISSLNDVQHHYEKPNQKLWDIEQNTFALRLGPKWLKIDEKTGEVSGTPDAPANPRIEIEVRNQFGGGAVQAFDITVQ